jgi:hypothetical protein
MDDNSANFCIFSAYVLPNQRDRVSEYDTISPERGLSGSLTEPGSGRVESACGLAGAAKLIGPEQASSHEILQWHDRDAVPFEFSVSNGARTNTKIMPAGEVQ